MITGTVTDQTPNAALKGTPAVSDADQGIWMEYMIQHNVANQPTSTGVPVIHKRIDPNGNSIHIGRRHKRQKRRLQLLVHIKRSRRIPDHSNLRRITAYGPSSAGTALAISAAAATPAPTATPAQSVADQYFVPAIAGLFVLIIIVAIVLALLMLRKK